MQTILITNKEEIKICDIRKIKGFDSTYFNIETALGDIYIKGNNLSMDNLNTATNEIIIKGDICNISLNEYIEKKQSFFKKLFK
ncbi:MAG: YabP/YqfC family sporulation protein [Anaeroplasmataceae bacterium]